MRTLRRSTIALTAIVAAATLVSGCSASSATRSSPDASGGEQVPFTVTSTDFVNEGPLPASAAGNAFGGQCEGENLNPALAWEGAPEGTESFAIVMIDVTASNFLHWQHVNIPADVTSVDAGGSSSLEGVPGFNSVVDQGYFGPCPPGSGNQYVFTVYAMDAMLDLPEKFTYVALLGEISAHSLGSAEIMGTMSNPSEG